MRSETEVLRHIVDWAQQLDAATWSAYQATFASGTNDDHWRALTNIVDLFTKLAQAVAAERSYTYATQLEADMRQYLDQIRLRS